MSAFSISYLRGVTASQIIHSHRSTFHTRQIYMKVIPSDTSFPCLSISNLIHTVTHTTRATDPIEPPLVKQTKNRSEKCGSPSDQRREGACQSLPEKIRQLFFIFLSFESFYFSLLALYSLKVFAYQKYAKKQLITPAVATRPLCKSFRKSDSHARPRNKSFRSSKSRKVDGFSLRFF